MDEYIQPDISPDGDISNELSSNYILSVQLSEDWFSYCILDQDSNKYIALSSYSLLDEKSKKKKDGDDSSYVEKLSSAFEWLKNPFKKVVIIYVSRSYEFIPSLLFDPSKRIEYMNFVTSVNDDDKVLYDSLPKLNLYNVFSLPAKLEKQLGNTFKSYKMIHYASALLLNVYPKLVDKSIKTQLFLNVQHNTFDLVVFNNGDFSYFNTFKFATDEDLIYYFFYVIDKLKLGLNDVSLKILGEVRNESTISRDIKKYIRDVSFVSRNSDFNYIDVFDDIPSHYFYNLLNAHLCV